MEPDQLEQAFTYCQQVASSHYENFPVASRLLPKQIRRAVSVIYVFARRADDLADEGDSLPAERIRALSAMGQALDGSGDTPPQEPLYMALAQVISGYRLPLQPFHDLLTAFRMDVEKNRFRDIDELMHYCSLSANPVGLLLLHLYQAATPENVAYSNAICSALQLINFYQDLAQDYRENNRIYLPQDEMQRFGVTEQHLQQQTSDKAMREMMALQFERARTLLASGTPLGRRLPGRMGLELRIIIQGGLRVLEKLEKQHDLFSRPRLNGLDWVRSMFRALRADKGSRINDKGQKETS